MERGEVLEGRQYILWIFLQKEEQEETQDKTRQNTRGHEMLILALGCVGIGKFRLGIGNRVGYY